MHVVVVYDIPDTKRRNKVFKTLKDYGKWMEFSAFECKVSKKDFLRLQDRILKIINQKKDRLIIYHLCDSCSGKVKYFNVEGIADEISYIV